MTTFLQTVTDLEKIADWAGFTLNHIVFGDTMDKLFKMDPNYTPTSNILFRTSVFKVMKTLERVKDATSRESCWRDLILLLVPVDEHCKLGLLEHISWNKWLTVYRQIINQIAVCVLLKHTQTYDDSDHLVELECNCFTISTGFKFSVYRNEVSTVFEEMKKYYCEKLECDGTVEEFTVDSNSFTKDLVETDSKTGKSTYRKSLIFKLIQKHSFHNCKLSLEKFFRNVEALMLPTPHLSVDYEPILTDGTEVESFLQFGKKPLWTRNNGLNSSEEVAGLTRSTQKISLGALKEKQRKTSGRRQLFTDESDSGNTTNDSFVSNGGDVVRHAARRKKAKRIPWTEQETNEFLEGVRSYGEGNWAVMLAQSRLGPSTKYHKDRTNIHLKDKWRNIGNKDDREYDRLHWGDNHND